MAHRTNSSGRSTGIYVHNRCTQDTRAWGLRPRAFCGTTVARFSMTSRTRWLVLGLALLGLAFAGAATHVHYRLLTQPNYVSPCDINARFNCSEVYLSSYGTVGGVSVAVGGLIFFGLVGLIAGLSEPKA